VHGAKLAWRNHARCIGRLHWPSLQVVDRRDATRPAEIFEACVEHLKQATNGGNLNSMITLFAPRRPDGGETRIWNSQLIRYAGYRMSDGSILGDPLNADLTDAVHTLGWQGEGGRFDILPLVIQTPGGEPQLFDLPREEILEVELHHPELPWFSDLGLRWHALPAISDMRMELGGLTYTACPFNGWYVSWEIGARNLSDENRYNLLPLIAERMGLDTRTPKTLWKDRALLELNHAVLHSFDEAGVKMVDHHTAAKQFCTHQDRETATGRITPTDWAWVVPPISGSTAPTFHRTYDNPDLRPNFYHQTPTWH
jgi:nitric-oxide synthase